MLMTDTHAFLENLFGDAVCEEAQLVVFVKPRVEWCASIEDAVKVIKKNQGNADTYFGVALQDKAAALKRAADRSTAKRDPHAGMVRGFSQTAKAIGGLWADVDYATSGHIKRGYPPTRESALSLIDEMPAQPTFILETGGGFHAWWMFEEPFHIETEEDREHAAWWAKGWQTLMRTNAAFRNWKVDSTHDLARVLRLPGTTNHKYGVGCVPYKQDGPLWTPDAFETWIPDGVHVAGDLSGGLYDAEVGPLELDPNAEPPGGKLAVLLDQHADFADAYHRRKKFESQSEYDLSLASHAVKAGWPQKDVVNLLIAHRRDEGLEPKLRQDYYAATLRRAGVESEDAEANERIMERVTLGKPAEGYSRSTKGDIMHDVSVRLGITNEIVRIVRMVGDPSTYRLELTDKTVVTLGPIRNLSRADLFRDAMLDAAADSVPMFKASAWQPIAQVIRAAAEDEHLGADSTVIGLVEEWMRGYTADGIAQDVAEGVSVGWPFMHDGSLHIRVSDLRGWLRVMGDPIGRGKLAGMLRTYEGVSTRIDFVSLATGKRTSTMAWKVRHPE